MNRHVVATLFVVGLLGCGPSGSQGETDAPGVDAMADIAIDAGDDVNGIEDGMTDASTDTTTKDVVADAADAVGDDSGGLQDTSCIPVCDDLECGGDGCDGICGECSQGEICQKGLCVSDGQCQPPCGDYEYCEEGQCHAGWLDPDTGLIWQNPANSDGFTWFQAKEYCNALQLGAQPDWRFPTHDELSSILSDYEFDGCYWKYGLDGECGVYWTANPDAQAPNKFFVVNFADGAELTLPKQQTHFVRCVRGEQGICVPDCAGKNCGSDGCGDSCGTCASGWSCDGGTCVEDACVPDCAGKNCGSDGCGDVCGTCGADEICESGQCLEPGECQPACGQYEYCDAGECKEGWQDPQTGYIWENPSPTGGFTWQEGLDHCVDLTDGGNSDWHLPTIGELLTLLMDSKDEVTNCYWPSGLMTLCVWGYWTSTLSNPGSYQQFPWRVVFNTGEYDHTTPVTSSQYIRCVRNTGCDPQCDGAECGEDGCGGHCGACGSGQECQSGECVQVSCAYNCGQLNDNADCDCDFQCWQNGTCCDDICSYCGDLYAAECN